MRSDCATLDRDEPGVTDLAIFVATSGHSGMDRIITNLLPALAEQGLRIDLLRIDRHGPYLATLPAGVREVRLGAVHVDTSLLALVRYLRRVRPRALLADKYRVNRVALWARRLARSETRLVVRIGTTVSHDLAQRGGLDPWLERVWIRWLYPKADAVIVPSRGAADDLATLARLSPQRITVLPNPVVRPELAARAAEELRHPWFQDARAPVILAAGELAPRKDFATLVRAFARVRGRREARLVILGEGRKRDNLMQLAAELGVAESLDLPGFIPNPYPYMARAAVFALTSTLEGFGIVLAEALSLGTPVVATDCPSGPAEILQGGRYGALVPVGDDAALAAALERALDAPAPPAQLQRAAQPYTVAASATAYAKILGLVGQGTTKRFDG
ncbi:glycosyltransferase [Nitrococcus mobilis]|uniref:Glycosyl transferase, group 1 n=1 Tax=Nitrococcus mobilis Nb-231 TaxID=314278 RepID=A4BL89_9GAMM|nr:glycosyltransferase [Nitrococcus mobilis]EAR23077.1 Glycosyl transferase, group 1 [Nitrococcus mobilis Nb-231]